MDKIYFAKSNKSNPDDVLRIRKLLSSYDVEVVEYSGGSYSNKPLSECAYLIVLPDLTTIEDEYINLGKGLHQQIEYFSNRLSVTENNRIVIIKNTDSGDIICDGLDYLDVVDTDDYINYSVAVVNNDEFNLDDYLENIFDIKQGQVGNKTNYTSNYYLLIGK